jgi:hypothetical protein
MKVMRDEQRFGIPWSLIVVVLAFMNAIACNRKSRPLAPTTEIKSAFADAALQQARRCSRLAIEEKTDSAAEFVVDMCMLSATKLEVGERERLLSAKKEDFRALSYVTSVEIHPATQFSGQGARMFAVFPSTAKLDVRGTAHVRETFVLGVSSDGGSTWRFADASQVNTPDGARMLVPDLPASFHLPTAN